MVCDECEREASGQLATPDVHSGGRNSTTARPKNENKALSSVAFRRNKCDACSVSLHVAGASFCQHCAHSKGACWMCGKTLFDTSMYDRKGAAAVHSQRQRRDVGAVASERGGSDDAELGRDSTNTSTSTLVSDESITETLARRIRDADDPDRPAFLSAHRFFGTKPGYFFGRACDGSIGYQVDPCQLGHRLLRPASNDASSIKSAFPDTKQTQYATCITRCRSKATGWSWLPSERVYFDTGLNVTFDPTRQVYIDHDANTLVPTPPPSSDTNQKQAAHSTRKDQEEHKHGTGQSQRSPQANALVGGGMQRQTAVSDESLRSKRAGKRCRESSK